MTHERLQEVLGTLFRLSVGVSIVMIATGGIMLLWCHGHDSFSYGVFNGVPKKLCTIGGIVGEACEWQSLGIIQLGTLVLMATPLLRIAFSLIVFLFNRDYMFVGISLLVLSVLFYSLFSGMR